MICFTLCQSLFSTEEKVRLEKISSPQPLPTPHQDLVHVHSCSWKPSWSRSVRVLQLLEETFLPPSDLGNISSGPCERSAVRLSRLLGSSTQVLQLGCLTPPRKAVDSMASNRHKRETEFKTWRKSTGALKTERKHRHKPERTGAVFLDSKRRGVWAHSWQMAVSEGPCLSSALLNHEQRCLLQGRGCKEIYFFCSIFSAFLGCSEMWNFVIL